MTTETDDLIARIAEGIARSLQGERAAARSVLTGVWEQVGADGDPFHRCAVARSMKDVVDHPAEALLWELRLLDAAGALATERILMDRGGRPVRRVPPSPPRVRSDVIERLGEMDRAS
jgi:hypothetical protein